MKRFACPVCQNEVHFENFSCLRCGAALGFRPETLSMAVAAPQDGAPAPVYCANARPARCNWFVPEGQDGGLCLACRHNRVVPNAGHAANPRRWAEIELAKRKLIYALCRWGLPHPTRAENPALGLAFDFLAEEQGPDGSISHVTTGHSNGLITLGLAEGDDVQRITRKSALEEPYRTVVGHLRHEIGHFYWALLIEGTGQIDACRALFGDERQDYGAALQRHYVQGAPKGWANTHISAYATAHPWEDFAETWAHWMHIVDGLETAAAYGIHLAGSLGGGAPGAEWQGDPYRMREIGGAIDRWVALTVAINNMNRGMGQPDLYPFVLSRRVIEKLDYINTVIHDAAG